MRSSLRLLVLAFGAVAGISCQSEQRTSIAAESTVAESTAAVGATSPQPQTETTVSPGDATPSAESAVTDLQDFLNLRTGRWTVTKVTPLSTSEGTVEGRPSYQMVGTVDMTVESSGTPRPSDLQNDPWLSKISGFQGERKSPELTLTWVKTEKGWKLRDIE